LNRSFAMLGIALACMSSAWAAKPVNLQHEPVSFLQSFFSASSSLQEVNSNIDQNKTTHVRMQQMYNGHQVWGAQAIMHVPQGGNITAKTLVSSIQGAKANSFLNGKIYQNLDADLSGSKASALNAEQAAVVLTHAKDLYLKSSNTKNALTEDKSDLIVFVDKDNKAHWAYLVSFLDAPAHGLPAKPTYIMDATNFKVYQNWNNIQTDGYSDGGGNGGNLKMGELVYDGLTSDLPKLSVTRDATNNSCALINDKVTVVDRRSNDAIVTYKCTQTDGNHNNVYWSGDQDAVNGGYSPSNDALYAGAVIEDMYQVWYKVDVLTQDGKPMMLKMRVHEYMDNAYWDGSSMTFGDGIDMFYPLVSLGVGAHEISHGFTEQHSGLTYSGQSGGLNEAFSDMAAQGAEFYSVGHNSWEIGPEIFKAPDEALRYMDEPTKDCKGGAPGNWCSISNVKDYYEGLDVHFSSGVFNKFFYLMGTAKGWDTKKAFDVMVAANMNYWTSGTTFVDAACGVLSAAGDLKYDTKAILNAAKTVGIDTSTCK
jgi:pseudolysin